MSELIEKLGNKAVEYGVGLAGVFLILKAVFFDTVKGVPVLGWLVLHIDIIMSILLAFLIYRYRKMSFTWLVIVAVIIYLAITLFKFFS